MVLLADIKKDLPGWPDDVIERWLLHLANRDDTGWPPPEPLGQHPWTYILGHRPLSWWKEVIWEQKPTDCSFSNLAKGTQKIVNEVIADVSGPSPDANTKARYNNAFHHILNHATFEEPLVTMALGAPHLAVVELVRPTVRPFVPPVGQISDVRGKSIFCNGFNVICPVQSLPAKIFRVRRSPQITDKTPASRPGRGALAIVTNVGAGCGGRGSVGRVVVFAGRALVRERTRARRRPAMLRTAKPCGPGTRCWCQADGGGVDPTGFRQTFNPSATVARRIRRRGERGISRKTIARGMSECSDCTCMLVCVLCTLLHTRPRVQQAPGIPRALFSLGGPVINSSGASRRETAESYSVSSPGLTG